MSQRVAPTGVVIFAFAVLISEARVSDTTVISFVDSVNIILTNSCP